MWVHAYVGFPGVFSFPFVAFIPAVEAFLLLHAIDGVLAVASFPADPGIPMLLSPV